MTVYALDDLTPVLPPAGRYWVAPGAHVIGQARLGLDVNVWFGAVIRADNDVIEIGDGTNIQEHCLLHADPGFPIRIGKGCVIGHHAIVHGCTIGDGVLLGMGATVINGAKIGNNCLVGAHSLVTEGKEFPDGMLIMGTPAKAVRPVAPEVIENIRKDAVKYAERAKRYAKGLRPIA